MELYASQKNQITHCDSSATTSTASFWLQNNFNAERLKDLFEQYGINTMGLQEVCINWSKFKSSAQTLASLLRHGPEAIRSVASFNKNEVKNMGNYQQGGTSTISVTNLQRLLSTQEWTPLVWGTGRGTS